MLAEATRLLKDENAQKNRTAGHVEARDLTEGKVELIRENIERTGLTNISAVCRDASVPDQGVRREGQTL